MYMYSIYGINVSSNIKIDYVNKLNDCNEKINKLLNLYLEVRYDYKEKEISPITITQIDETINIDLNPFAFYTIDIGNKLIRCSACNYEAFFSTFFNIPLSVYTILSGEFILHTSSMLINDKLICFIGEKGIGKSTTSRYLENEDIEQYSDDTLKIDSNNCGYRGNKLTKLNVDSLKFLKNVKFTGHSNAVGKKYIELNSDYTPHVIGAIILLKRGAEKITFSEIKSEMAYYSVLLSNVIGINYFTSDMIKKAITLVKKIHIPMYILKLPNDIEQLSMNKNEIIKLILNKI